MENLFRIRGILISIYKRYEMVAKYILKFIFAYIVFTGINNSLGVSSGLNKWYIVLILALLSSVLSEKWTLLFSILLTSVNLFSVSVEGPIIITCLMLMTYLIFVRMFPELSYIVLLIPICYYLKIPFVIPLCVGILVGIRGVVSVTIGTFVWHFTKYLAELVNMKSKQLVDIPETLATMNKFIISSMSQNTEMIVSIIVFIAAIASVCIINRLAIDYANYIAVTVGMAVNIIGFMIGIIVMDIDINIFLLLISAVTSLLIVYIILFFKVALNYKAAQKVQFEDDEYYYYVKLIPKVKK